MATHCRHCDALLPQVNWGRERLYCSNRCRLRCYYRRRLEEANASHVEEANGRQLVLDFSGFRETGPPSPEPPEPPEPPDATEDLGAESAAGLVRRAYANYRPPG
jgi:hypothetical protein